MRLAISDLVTSQTFTVGRPHICVLRGFVSSENGHWTNMVQDPLPPMIPSAADEAEPDAK